MYFQLNLISLMSSTSLFFVVLLCILLVVFYEYKILVVFYLYDFQIERIYEVKLTAECLVGDTG